MSETGEMAALGAIDLDTGGRSALDEQLRRLRNNTDDPALLIGTAKELLESVAKHVLDELDLPRRENADFSELWHLARERLGLLPQSFSAGDPGGEAMRSILGSAWKIAEQVNHLRKTDGTGHGRTLITGVSPDAALLVVREAISVAELTLSTLDRHLSR